jgi:hypothetical protein
LLLFIVPRIRRSSKIQVGPLDIRTRYAWVTRCYFWRFFFDLHPNFGRRRLDTKLRRDREREREKKGRKPKIRRRKYRKTRRCGIGRTMKTVSFRMVLSTDFRPSRRVRAAPGPVVDSFRSNFRRKRSTSTSERRLAVSRCRNCLGSNTRSFQCFDRFGSVWRPRRCRQIAKMARYSGKRWTNLSAVPNRNRDDPVLGLVVGGART